MIVSNAEIARVLELVGCRAVPWSEGDPLPGGREPLAEDLSPPIRLVLIRSLQEMLAAGMYEIPAEMLAEKIIGRAICDQAHQLCDMAEREPASIV